MLANLLYRKLGLGPGKQVIIKKPKARPAGSTPYTDETIHPNTLLFLADLKVNNNREWLKCKFDPLFVSFDRMSLSSKYIARLRLAMIEKHETKRLQIARYSYIETRKIIQRLEVVYGASSRNPFKRDDM